MPAFKVEASDLGIVAQIGATLLAGHIRTRDYTAVTDAELDRLGDLAVRAALAFEWKARDVAKLRAARLEEEAAAEAERVAAEKVAKAAAAAEEKAAKHGHGHR